MTDQAAKSLENTISTCAACIFGALLAIALLLPFAGCNNYNHVYINGGHLNTR